MTDAEMEKLAQGLAEEIREAAGKDAQAGNNEVRDDFIKTASEKTAAVQNAELTATLDAVQRRLATQLEQVKIVRRVGALLGLKNPDLLRNMMKAATDRNYSALLNLWDDFFKEASLP